MIRNFILVAVILSLPIGMLLGKKSFELSIQVTHYWSCDYGFGLGPQLDRCTAADPRTRELVSWLHLPKAVLHYPVKLLADLAGYSLDAIYGVGVLLLILLVGYSTARYAGSYSATGGHDILLLSLALYVIPAWFTNGRMLFAFLGLTLLFNLAARGKPGLKTAAAGALAVLFCAISSGGLLVGQAILGLVMLSRPALRLPLLPAFAAGMALLFIAIEKLWMFYSADDSLFLFEVLQHGLELLGLDDPVGAQSLAVYLAVLAIIATGAAFLLRRLKKLSGWPIHLTSMLAIAVIAPFGGGVASMLLPCAIAEACIRYQRWVMREPGAQAGLPGAPG